MIRSQTIQFGIIMLIILVMYLTYNYLNKSEDKYNIINKKEQSELTKKKKLLRMTKK